MSKIAPTGQVPSSATATRLLLFLAPAFAPIAYLHDMAEVILQQDNKAIQAQADGSDATATPLTERERAVVEYLNDTFKSWQDAHLRDEQTDDLIAEMAESITRLAIKRRARSEDNSETAKWLVFWIQEGQDIYDTALFINDLGIADVGPERARQLAQTFKGIDNFIAASEEDLMQVPSRQRRRLDASSENWPRIGERNFQRQTGNGLVETSASGRRAIKEFDYGAQNSH